MKTSSAIRHPAALILTAYLLLALTYSALAPIFESSDEPFHFAYVAYISEGLGLPVQQGRVNARWENLMYQEASQPPLFYLLAAALVRPVDLSDLALVHVNNPHARIGDASYPENRNMMIHSDRERFPWHGTTLAVHLARLFSILLGAGTVCCTYLLSRRLAPHRPAVALGAMAVNAFLPMFIYISASVNNDNLVVFLSSLTLLLLVQLLSAERGNHPPARMLVLIGVVIGFAALTKLTGLALMPLACLALLLTLDISSGRGRWLLGYVRDCILVLAPALLIAGWWYLRNWQLYGDPTGLNAMLDVAGRRVPPANLTKLVSEFQGFRINFWGLFGAVNVLLKPVWAYRLLDVVCLAAGAGLVIAAVRLALRVARGGQHVLALVPWRGWLLAATWIAVVFVSLVRWTSVTLASQGRLMFPTISALAFFFVAGLTALGESAGLLWGTRPARRASLAGAVVLPSMLLPLAIAAPFVSILPSYARPPAVTNSAIPASAVRQDLTYGDVIHLLAVELAPKEVRPGEGLDVTLFWEGLKPSDRDYSFYLKLFGRDGSLLGQIDTYPGGGKLPTSRLVPHQIVRDQYRVPVDRLPEGGPVVARLEFGLYDSTTGERLPVRSATGESAGATVARVKVAGVPLASTEQMLQPLNADFGDSASLAGYALSEPAIRPGDTFTVTLLWHALSQLDADYTVFLHLRDATNRTVAQGDGPPAGGDYPTSSWAAGEALFDSHPITVPADLPPGRYELVAGLYEPKSGRRMFLAHEGAGTEAHVGTVEVAPSPATRP